MIPAGATRIKAVVLDNGWVNVSFEGTKVGIAFSGLDDMKQKIALVQELNPYAQMMLQLAEHLKSDPSLASTATLSAKPFIAEPASLSDLVID